LLKFSSNSDTVERPFKGAQAASSRMPQACKRMESHAEGTGHSGVYGVQAS